MYILYLASVPSAPTACNRSHPTLIISLYSTSIYFLNSTAIILLILPDIPPTLKKKKRKQSPCIVIVYVNPLLKRTRTYLSIFHRQKNHHHHKKRTYNVPTVTCFRVNRITLCRYSDRNLILRCYRCIYHCIIRSYTRDSFSIREKERERERADEQSSNYMMRVTRKLLSGTMHLQYTYLRLAVA